MTRSIDSVHLFQIPASWNLVPPPRRRLGTCQCPCLSWRYLSWPADRSFRWDPTAAHAAPLSHASNVGVMNRRGHRVTAQ